MAATTNGGPVVKTTDANVDEVIGTAGVALVDFGAAWCPPCRMMEPIVEKLAEAYAGRVRVGALDTDANPRAAGRWNVRNLPTFLVFKDGQVVDTIIGAVGRDVLEKRVQAQL